MAGEGVTLISQLGNNFPKDIAVENRLRSYMKYELISYSSFIEAVGKDRFSKDVNFRVRALHDFIEGLESRNIVILARSSGLRVATRLAHEGCPRLRGIAGIAYPFRFPQRAHEPTRVDHLANLSVPTLIFQGEQDPYGGTEAASLYELSAAIELNFVPADHDFRVPNETWDWVGGQIAAFVDRVCG